MKKWYNSLIGVGAFAPSQLFDTLKYHVYY
nr:MAG TPA: hypothetical protein [Caudoviricetes sp.]